MKNVGLLVAFIFLSFSGIAQTSKPQETSSSEQFVSRQKVKVFPNPATNVVNVLGLENSSRSKIIISDISGNIVLQHEWAIRNNAISIPIPNLDAGIYVVQINSLEQKIQTKFYKN